MSQLDFRRLSLSEQTCCAEKALHMATFTLQKMAAGGMHGEALHSLPALQVRQVTMMLLASACAAWQQRTQQRWQTSSCLGSATSISGAEAKLLQISWEAAFIGTQWVRPGCSSIAEYAICASAPCMMQCEAECVCRS